MLKCEVREIILKSILLTYYKHTLIKSNIRIQFYLSKTKFNIYNNNHRGGTYIV